MTPVETVLAFFDAINQHDPDRLAEMMTDDHVFIDSLGNSVRGREKMRAGWRAYFTIRPEHRRSIRVRRRHHRRERKPDPKTSGKLPPPGACWFAAA